MRGDQGSAIVLAMLVTVILTLLGISFLLMSDTENRIAQNEKLAAQALYAADASTRAVKSWFDRPGAAGPIPFPAPSVVRRDLRVIDVDGPGPVAPRSAAAGEGYKEGIDFDSNGLDDLFDRPYRGSVQHLLTGTDSGPDMRIDDVRFLDDLSESLFADFPDAGSGVVARIVRIDIFAPPMVETIGGWARFGIGTVKVVVRILDDGNTVAESELAAVLNEAPYQGPYGPLHSCAGLTLQTAGAPFPVHWGVVTAIDTVVVDGAGLPSGPPRSTSGFPRRDPLWGPAFGATLAQYNSRLNAGADDLGDPWFRLLTAGTIAGHDEEPGQPFPSGWIDWDGVAATPGLPIDDSNLAQAQYVDCPDYPYDVWKMIATSGGVDVRYFGWDSADKFVENGRGHARSFQDITDGEEGLFFFETQDGLAPAADESNLTPKIVLSGTWSFRGLIYLNAKSVQTKDLVGVPIDFVAPGEPFEDLNQNGRFDAGSETWIDLTYPNTLSGAFTAGGGAGRQSTSPTVIRDTASMNGILYTNGRFEATGAARHHGAIVARGGVVQTEATTEVPEIYWDPSITDAWPLNEMRLPRVILTAWTTDP